jgi:hypothetical protein
MERLTSALKSALEQKQDLQAVVSALENIAPTSEERQGSKQQSLVTVCYLVAHPTVFHIIVYVTNHYLGSIKSYEDLVKKYRDSQVQLKNDSRPKVLSKTKSASQFFSVSSQ